MRVYELPAAEWSLLCLLLRACELSSAWLQLACRQHQGEPQFALTLGRKIHTHRDHKHIQLQLQLMRVYIDIGR